MSATRANHPGWTLLKAAGLGLLMIGAFACSADDGAPGAPGAAQPRKKVLDAGADLPGLVIAITKLEGGSGPGGNFQPGDVITVEFTLRDKAGRPYLLRDLDFSNVLVSGPATNYQRVIPAQSDLVARSVPAGGVAGTFRYTFALPIPPVYAQPYNDTPSFGPADGEMTGQPLVDGTYSLGIEAYVGYTVGDESFRDADNAVEHFLVGNATSLDLREVVKLENCNQCHQELRLHGTVRREISHCVLCHTAGAEDKNEPSAAGGTPGVSIDFKVMIHKIHNGAHLPSVLGVATNADGSRDYAATPKPYEVVGFRNSVHDYSHVGFPVWPNLAMPLPRDVGHSGLSSAQRGLEDSMRRGAAECGECHGDPDGTGPLTAPEQGHLAFSKPGRAACGSCHDDIDWAKPYVANLLRMPPQADDSQCRQCHQESGSLLAIRDAHVHPLNDPKLNPGLKVEITSVTESGTNNGNGKLDPGEKLRVGLRLRDRNGLEIDASTLARMEAAVNGPTTNRNLLIETRFPSGSLSGADPSTHLPEPVFLDFSGVSSATGSEQFTSSRTPHWSGSTTVRVRPAGPLAAVNVLATAATPLQNHVDLDAVDGLARGDYVVIDDGITGKEEYLRIQLVDGNRLWFSSGHSPYDQPWLRFAHDMGATVAKVTLTEKKPGTDYTLNATTGQVTEVTEFGDGAKVLMSYTTDFVLPAVYAPPSNESPDLDETWGEWTGKSLVSGTYTVAVWGELTVSVVRSGETNSYVGASAPAVKDFLVGSATKIVPNNLISSAANCYACHNDIYFHGSHRRGFETCLMCHGAAGGEDRPRYVAANAGETKGVTIDFRRMLHKIHHGKELANASTYAVNGFGLGYPNNFSAHTYEHVGFPAMPGGTKQCAKCHGAGNDVWQVPAKRDHPTEQGKPARVWMVACGSCHDSDAAQSHIQLQTAKSGHESCAVCHGPGKELAAGAVHKSR